MANYPPHCWMSLPFRYFQRKGHNLPEEVLVDGGDGKCSHQLLKFLGVKGVPNESSTEHDLDREVQAKLKRLRSQYGCLCNNFTR